MSSISSEWAESLSDIFLKKMSIKSLTRFLYAGRLFSCLTQNAMNINLVIEVMAYGELSNVRIMSAYSASRNSFSLFIIISPSNLAIFINVLSSKKYVTALSVYRTVWQQGVSYWSFNSALINFFWNEGFRFIK